METIKTALDRTNAEQQLSAGIPAGTENRPYRPAPSEQIAYLKMLQEAVDRLTKQIVGSRNWCLAILATTLAWFTQPAAGTTVYLVEILFCTLTCLFFAYQTARYIALRNLFQERYDRLAAAFPYYSDTNQIFCMNWRIFAPDFSLLKETNRELWAWKVGGIYAACWLVFVLAMLLIYIGLSAEHHMKALAHIHAGH